MTIPPEIAEPIARPVCDRCNTKKQPEDMIPGGLGAYLYISGCWHCYENGLAVFYAAGWDSRGWKLRQPWMRPQTIGGTGGQKDVAGNLVRVRFSRNVVLAIMRRQDMTCANCLDSFDLTTIRYAVDHLIPLWDGGQDTAQNLQLLCQDCHNPKGAMRLERWNEVKGAVALAARARHILRRDFYPQIEKDKRFWYGRQCPLAPINWNRRPPLLQRGSLERAATAFRSPDRNLTT